MGELAALGDRIVAAKLLIHQLLVQEHRELTSAGQALFRAAGSEKMSRQDWLPHSQFHR